MSTIDKAVAPWRPFDVDVRELKRLSPSFLRVTFGGDDLDRFADNGFDLRVKLILPAPEGGLAMFPDTVDWFTTLRALPVQQQCPIRTYTCRAVRPDKREVDVDIVMHPHRRDGPGPVARWAESIAVGDEIKLLGPDRDYTGVHGGIDFRPPSSMRRVLIAADETAVPAVAAIMKELRADVEAEVLVEVPHAADAAAVSKDLPAVTGNVTVTVMAREQAPHGAQLIPSVVKVADRMILRTVPGTEVEDIDVDDTLLWESPGDAAQDSHGLYAWLAGEAAVIKNLRRHLVTQRGLNRKSVAFMGYWRQGRPEGG